MSFSKLGRPNPRAGTPRLSRKLFVIVTTDIDESGTHNDAQHIILGGSPAMLASSVAFSRLVANYAGAASLIRIPFPRPMLKSPRSDRPAPPRLRSGPATPARPQQGFSRLLSNVVILDDIAELVATPLRRTKVAAIRRELTAVGF